jgi:hypothetical protein
METRNASLLYSSCNYSLACCLNLYSFFGVLCLQDIVIGTPGRMKDLIEMGVCRLNEVSFVVIPSCLPFCFSCCP